ncbi:MAG: alanine--tRNA ligase-related protein [Aliidongia sp.]
MPRIAFLGIEDNWWATGDEGPCGPDTEIFYDTKNGVACELGADCKPGCKCNRWVEIWNNVFMAYNRTGGQLVDLPKRNVDTGMGLERTLAVLNGVDSAYDTTAFRPILEALIAKSKFTETEIRANPELLKALRITADHLRTSVFVHWRPARHGAVEPGGRLCAAPPDPPGHPLLRSARHRSSRLGRGA